MHSDQIQIRSFVRPCRTFGGQLALFAKGRKKYVVIATEVPLWQGRAQVYDFKKNVLPWPRKGHFLSTCQCILGKNNIY